MSIRFVKLSRKLVIEILWSRVKRAIGLTNVWPRSTSTPFSKFVRTLTISNRQNSKCKQTELLRCVSKSPAKYYTFEFSLNVFTEFSDKNICHYSKRVRTCHPSTSCVRDQDATTVSVRHMWETGSLIWPQFMLQWFIRFPEFLFHLGKTSLFLIKHTKYFASWLHSIFGSH